MSARTDPRGGRWATGVPTATPRCQYHWLPFIFFLTCNVETPNVTLHCVVCFRAFPSKFTASSIATSLFRPSLSSTASDRGAAPCGAARIRLTVSQVCDEMNLLNPEGPWVYKSAHPGELVRLSYFLVDSNNGRTVTGDSKHCHLPQPGVNPDCHRAI